MITSSSVLLPSESTSSRVSQPITVEETEHQQRQKTDGTDGKTPAEEANNKDPTYRSGTSSCSAAVVAMKSTTTAASSTPSSPSTTTARTPTTLPTDVPILSAAAAAAAAAGACEEEIVDDGEIGGGDGMAVVKKQIVKSVLRQKLQKLRHLVLPNVINPKYLDTLFPQLLEKFDPQTVSYNGGVAQIKEWKISCYLEVMDGGVPTANPNVQLLDLFLPLLDKCNDLFMEWYKQQHSCNNINTSDKGGGLSFWERRARQKQQQQEKQKQLSPGSDVGTAIQGKENVSASPSKLSKAESSTSEKPMQSKKTSSSSSCRRLMTFITRYTPAPGEQALLKHVDGAGKVDGSCVVALPIDKWSAPYDVNTFEGHGGGLTFWDGKERIPVPRQHDDDDDENVKGTTATSSTTTTTTMTTMTRPREIHYDTRSGDIAFIDKAVWHQADPITKGTRWALVIFYKVE